MVEISRQLICVADSSKFNVTGLVSVCPISMVDTLITDAGVAVNFKNAVETIGVKVITT
jgi:DeoR/GlpR family transcriptional regulator of sugar metabolism